MFSLWNFFRVFRCLHLLAYIAALCITSEFVLAGSEGPQRTPPEDSLGFQARFERLVGAEHLSDSTSTTEREDARDNADGSDLLPERFRRIVEIELETRDLDIDIDIQPFGREARILRRKHRVPRGHLALGIVPPAALFSQVMLGKRVKAEILETASPQSAGTPPSFYTGRNFGSGSTPVQSSPQYFPPFSPSWSSFANFFSGSQDTSSVEDYPDTPVSDQPFGDFASTPVTPSPSSLVPSLKEAYASEDARESVAEAEGNLFPSGAVSPSRRRRSPSTLEPLKFQPPGSSSHVPKAVSGGGLSSLFPHWISSPSTPTSPAFETPSASGKEWQFQRQVSGLWNEGGSETLRAVVTHPGAITLSAVATAAAALMVGQRLWRIWKSRGRNSEVLLDAYTASWDVGRCLLLVDIKGARESGSLRGSFVPGSAQVSVNWVHQVATISYKFIPSASKGIFSFIARRGIRAHQRFRVPMDECYISPQKEKSAAAEAQTASDGAEASLSEVENLIKSPPVTSDFSESGASVSARRTQLSQRAKKRRASRAEEAARLEASSFVREHLQRSLFGSKTTALVVKFDANPGPTPIQRLPNPGATLPAALFQQVKEHIALANEAYVQLEGNSASTPALSAILQKRPLHSTKSSAPIFILASNAAVSESLCSWDLAVDASLPLNVTADIANQTLMVAQSPRSIVGCFPLLRSKLGATSHSSALWHEIHLSDACALASTAHAGYSVDFVKVPLQNAESVEESEAKEENAESGAAFDEKGVFSKQQESDESSSGFRLVQHVRIELKPCPRKYHKRSLPKLPPRVMED